jgi:transglutaminase superfamily protein
MPGTIQRYRKVMPKLRALSGREWRDLIAAQVRLLFAQFSVATRRTGSLVATHNATVSAADSGGRLGDARALALAVSRAAEYGVFRPACLVRSMALSRMLSSRGIRGARVQIGVILRSGRFAAHAWVEYAGEVLGDDPSSVSHFDPLPGLSFRDSAPKSPR